MGCKRHNVASSACAKQHANAGCQDGAGSKQTKHVQAEQDHQGTDCAQAHKAGQLVCEGKQCLDHFFSGCTWLDACFLQTTLLEQCVEMSDSPRCDTTTVAVAGPAQNIAGPSAQRKQAQ